MKFDFIEEPEMEFGTGTHIDVKFGIMENCVLDFDQESAPRKINLGIIGTDEEIAKFSEWLEVCRNRIPGKESNKKNIFPAFPGFSPSYGFCSEIILEKTTQRSLPPKELAEAIKFSGNEKVEKLVELIETEIEYLTSKHKVLNVIAVTVPRAMAKAMIADLSDTEETEVEQKNRPKKVTLDFRRLLKAKTQKYKVPIQIVLPSTYDPSLKTKIKIGSSAEGSLQDPATRAWNFFTALYYKAGGTPWRLKRDSHDLQTCFIGVSFYRGLNEESIQTSVAQVFNERGEGMIIRGGAAKSSKDDKQIHMEEEEAKKLIGNAIRRYKQEHKHSPARVVIHKTSDFDQGEINGITAAINEENIEIFDMLSISKSLTRLHRPGNYPPLRGTFWELDEENNILYTKGSVDFFQTYPGLYVPKTLKFKVAYTTQPIKALAKEIMSLTKMNWNNTQLDNSLPITIKAARQVGEILKYISADESYIEPNYCFYM